jgi:hypothetical protein
VWEKVAVSPSFALDAANLVLLLKVDDWVAEPLLATLAPFEYTSSSNSWMGCSVVEWSFTFSKEMQDHEGLQ